MTTLLDFIWLCLVGVSKFRHDMDANCFLLFASKCSNFLCVSDYFSWKISSRAWFFLLLLKRTTTIICNIYSRKTIEMGRHSSKGDDSASSAESVTSDNESEQYVVEKVVGKRISKGKVSSINFILLHFRYFCSKLLIFSWKKWIVTKIEIEFPCFFFSSRCQIVCVYSF